MKSIKILVVIAFSIFLSLNIYGQNGINYQAVARDGSGNLIANSNVTVKFSIFSGTGGTLMIYSETHSTTTNAYGVFNLSIGKGNSTLGTFSNIDWGLSEHHLQVELSTGSGFVDMGTFPFEHVPYAKTATDMSIKDMKDVDLTGVSSGNVLQYDGAVWKPGTGGGTGGSVWAKSGSDISYTGGNVNILGSSTLGQLFIAPNSATGGGSSEIILSELNSLLTQSFKLKYDGQDNHLKFLYGISSTPLFQIGINEITSYRNFNIDNRSLFVKDGTGNTKVFLGHNNTTGLGGEVVIYRPGGIKTLELSGTEGTNNGSVINMYQYNGKKTIELDGDYGNFSSGYISLHNSNEVKTVEIFATETATQGSTMKMYNDSGHVTIELDADFGGDGRIIADEVEIKGGADLAEFFDISLLKGSAPLPGMVVSIDPQDPGKLIVTNEAYDQKVAGVISGANGVKPGMKMGQQGSIANGDYPVALTGRVYVLADASKGKIKPGDLLCSSNKPGYAMKVKNHRKAQGAIIGKAITGLEDKEGYVLILVSLQ